jgi:NAD(P)H dehydrogenase (quinone)
VTREDCAVVATAALSATFDGRRTFEITGPMAVTAAMIARWASETTGRPIVVEPVSVAEVQADLETSGVPTAVAAALASIEAGIAHGEFAKSSRAVAELAGRAATNLPSFLRAHRAHLIAT